MPLAPDIEVARLGAMLTGWGVGENEVEMTLYTNAFIIRGVLATRHRRLSDILNFAEDDFLVLADAKLQALGGRQEHHEAPHAQVNLSAVLFAVASETIAPMPEFRQPKVVEATLISIPPFSVTGSLHLMPERDFRSALQELHGRFIPVTDVTYWSETLGEAARTAPMLAVNHALAQILSPYRGPEGGAAPRGRTAAGARR
jgi:hypothetical protein